MQKNHGVLFFYVISGYSGETNNKIKSISGNLAPVSHLEKDTLNFAVATIKHPSLLLSRMTFPLFDI